MKNTFPLFLIFACLCSTGCTVTPGQDSSVALNQQVCKATGRQYGLYLPSTYTPNNRYPVIISLHGKSPWDSAEKQLEEWKSIGEDQDCIIITPELKSVDGLFPHSWAARKKILVSDDAHILAVLDEVGASYSLDSSRILLVGFSDGGYALYNTGLNHPERFSMLIARGCDIADEFFDEFTPTPEAKNTPVVLMIGKYDTSSQKDNWTAFRWLRTHGWTKEFAKRNVYAGGHLRRTQIAFECWNPGAPASNEQE